jgi:hypothetical protein
VLWRKLRYKIANGQRRPLLRLRFKQLWPLKKLLARKQRKRLVWNRRPRTPG